MRESGVELCVGDSVLIENRVLTIIDIAGDEVTFRIDHRDDDPVQLMASAALNGRLPPR